MGIRRQDDAHASPHPLEIRPGTGETSSSVGRDAGTAVERFERIRLIKLLRRFDAAFLARVEKDEHRPFWQIISYLVESADSGKVVTITSLTACTGLPYSTSRRFILDLIAQGRIVQQPRTSTGRTFSLHVSPETAAAFDAFLEDVKRTLIEMFDSGQGAVKAQDYYFGANRITELRASDRQAITALADKQLRLLLHDDPYFNTLRNLWSDFRSGIGVKSDIAFMLGQQLRQEIATNHTRDQSAYDIVSVDFAYLDELAARGIVRPLDDLFDEPEPAGSGINRLSGVLGRCGGRLYGVPVYCATQMFAARSDLFERAGLAFPLSYQEVLTAARTLQSPALGRSGIVWDAAAGMAVAATFRTLLVSAGAFRGLAENPLTGPPGNGLSTERFVEILGTDEAMQALEFLCELVEVSPPNILDMGWSQTVDVFMRGKAAMCLSWSNYMSQVEYDPISVARHRIKYLTLPSQRGGARAMPLSGYVLSIPVNLPDARASAAAQAIKWLISTEAKGKHTAMGLPVTPRFATVADPETRHAIRMQNFILKMAEMRLLQVRYRPTGPNFMVYEELLGVEIHAALSRRTTPAQALRTASEKILRLERASARP